MDPWSFAEDCHVLFCSTSVPLCKLLRLKESEDDSTIDRSDVKTSSQTPPN